MQKRAVAKKDKAARAKRHAKRSAKRSAKRKAKKKQRQKKSEFFGLLPTRRPREAKRSRKTPRDVDQILAYESRVPLSPKVAKARIDSYLMVIRRRSPQAADILATLDPSRHYIVRASYSGPRYHEDSDTTSPVRLVFVGEVDYILSALARAARHGTLSRLHIRRLKQKTQSRPLWKNDVLTSVQGAKKVRGRGMPIPRAEMKAAREKARKVLSRMSVAERAALRELYGPGADDDAE